MVSKGNAPRRSRSRRNATGAVLQSPTTSFASPSQPSLGSPSQPSLGSPSQPSQPSQPSLTPPAQPHATPPPTTGMTTQTPNNFPHNDLGGSPAIPPQPNIAPLFDAHEDLPPLWVKDDHFMPNDNKPSRIIGKTIREKYDGFWPTFRSIPQNIRQLWCDHFESHFSISEDIIGAVKHLFEKRVARRLSDLLSDARFIYFEYEEKVDWIDDEVFKKLVEYWESDAFKKKSNTNKANRHRVKEGQPVGKHTGGSRSAYDTMTWLEKNLERPVAGAEVFTYMHTSKKEKSPIDEIASQIEQNFKKVVPDILPYLGEKRKRIPDDLLKQADKALVACAGGVRKTGLITGLGNLSTKYTNATSSRPQLLQSETEVQELMEQVSHLSEENRNLLEDVRAMNERLAEERRQTAAREERLDAQIARIMKCLGSSPVLATGDTDDDSDGES